MSLEFVVWRIKTFTTRCIDVFQAEGICWNRLARNKVLKYGFPLSIYNGLRGKNMYKCDGFIKKNTLSYFYTYEWNKDFSSQWLSRKNKNILSESILVLTTSWPEWWIEFAYIGLFVELFAVQCAITEVIQIFSVGNRPFWRR